MGSKDDCPCDDIDHKRAVQAGLLATCETREQAQERWEDLYRTHSPELFEWFGIFRCLTDGIETRTEIMNDLQVETLSITHTVYFGARKL
jgi:hypothetical protein